MSCDRQLLLEPDLGVRIVVVARDVVVAGAFVKCDGLGEGGVGVEPNGLVAKVGRGRFKVAQQPGAEPCAAPFRIDPHALDFTGLGSHMLNSSAPYGLAVAGRDDEGRSVVDDQRWLGGARCGGIKSVGESAVQFGEVTVYGLLSRRRSGIDLAELDG